MQGDKITTYQLIRNKDVHGISGTGIVALIAKLPSGRCVMEWVSSNHPTITIFANIDEIIAIHGHGGQSVIESIETPKTRTKKGKK